LVLGQSNQRILQFVEFQLVCIGCRSF